MGKHSITSTDITVFFHKGQNNVNQSIPIKKENLCNRTQKHTLQQTEVNYQDMKLP